MKRARGAVIWCVVAAVFFASAGCRSQSAKPGRGGLGETPSAAMADAAVVDEALLAWLSRARALHHLADMAEDSGDLDRAIALLTRLIGEPRLPDGYAEQADVLADTYARLAELRSRKGDHREALREIAVGFEFARERSYYRGHLFEVRGVVTARLAKELEAAGKHEEALRFRTEAMAASGMAVRIQEEVIRTTLGDAEAPSPNTAAGMGLDAGVEIP